MPAIEFLVIMGVLLLAIVPVSRLARQRGRSRTPWKWATAALFVALGSASLTWSSNNLTEKCVAAGNGRCLDAGAAGMKAVFIVIFICAALLSAWLMHND